MSEQSKVLDTWHGWLDGIDTGERLRERMTQRAIALDARHCDSPVVAVERLRDAWKNTYVPNDAHLGVIAHMVERVRLLATRRMPTSRAYEQAVYSRQPMVFSDQEIWGLTGLAGVGKSSAMKALVRALSPAPSVFLTSSVQVPMRPVIHLTIRSQRSSSPVLRSLANPVFVAGRQNIAPAELAEHLRQWLYTQGTQLLIVDELQSMTRGESSSTLIANLVAELNELGPAVVYIFNYSLGHKLLTRNQEDKDRLLAKTLIMNPSREGTPEWVAQVGAHVAVAPDLFDIEAGRDARELHRLTGGLCRLLGLLLLEACRNSWLPKVGRRVTMADVRAAYTSSAYASQRADIEDLRSLPVNSRLRDKRKDLLCPFPDLSSLEADANSSPSATDLPPPAAIHVMESALNHGARHVLKELRAQADDVSSGERKAATVTKLTRRPALTAEALLAGAKLLSGSGSSKEQILPTEVGTED